MAIDFTDRERLIFTLAFILSQKVPKSTLNTLAKPPTRDHRERAFDQVARILADELIQRNKGGDYDGRHT